MSEYDEVLFCPTCNTRAVFNVGGTGKVAICMDCGNEIEPTIEGRLKACMDFIFATMSNRLDK